MNQLKVTGTQKIGEHEFTGIEGGFGEGKKAMLVKDIAEIHGQPVSEINRRINDNRKWFEDGVDIIDLKSDMGLSHNEIRDFGFSQNAINKSGNIYVLSEQGYSNLLKILEDDTAWTIYKKFVKDYFGMRRTIKQRSITAPQDDYAKRLRAKAMDQNARNRAAEKLIALANNATSEVNKALLQDKAVEVLTGEKLLEMPTLASKMYSTDEIAKELGVLSDNNKPHGTAVSWLIKRYLTLKNGDYDVFAESVNGWSGTVTRYSQSVVERLKERIVSLGYPTIVTSEGGINYHVHYRDIV
jgi:ORF6N domain.